VSPAQKRRSSDTTQSFRAVFEGDIARSSVSVTARRRCDRGRLAAAIGGTGYADVGGNARERTVRFDLRTSKLGRSLPPPLPDLLQGDSAPFAAAGF
jgi:hypothetical protein